LSPESFSKKKARENYRAETPNLKKSNKKLLKKSSNILKNPEGLVSDSSTPKKPLVKCKINIFPKLI